MEKKNKNKKYPKVYRNSDTILTSLIGGAIVGSYILASIASIPATSTVGAVIGGISGAIIGYKNKETHPKA